MVFSLVEKPIQTSLGKDLRHEVRATNKKKPSKISNNYAEDVVGPRKEEGGGGTPDQLRLPMLVISCWTLTALLGPDIFLQNEHDKSKTTHTSPIILWSGDPRIVPIHSS